MHRLYALFALTIFITVWTATVAMAGTFGPGTRGKCQVKFEGLIENGDAARFEAMLGRFLLNTGETSGQVLCLSGPGGSFAEAMRMGRILIDKGIGTRLEADEQCLSACAILFMMGSMIFYEGIGDGQNANRTMHATSRLGFHRPELKLGSGQQYDAGAIEKSFDLAIEATLEFVRLANEDTRQSTMVPSDLLERIFEHAGEDYFFLETTGQTVRWDIKVDGLDLPNKMTASGAWHACTNLGVWPVRYEPDIHAFEPSFVEQVANPPEGPVFAVSGALMGDAPHFCLLQYRPQSKALYGCGLLGMENRVVGPQECLGGSEIGRMSYITSDARVFMPANTPLRANAAAPQPGNRPLPLADGAREFRARCGAGAQTAFVAQVRNFTNLRSAASIGTDKLEEVPLNARVSVLSQPVFDIGGISVICEYLCGSARNAAKSGAELAELSRCFEANAFWFRVRTPTGREGFLSGKFLRR